MGDVVRAVAMCKPSGLEPCYFSYLVDPVSDHMVWTKIKPCTRAHVRMRTTCFISVSHGAVQKRVNKDAVRNSSTDTCRR